MIEPLFTLIQSPTKLEEVCNIIQKSAPEWIALDTEFMRQNTYWPEVCLLQIKTEQGLWILDLSALGLQSRTPSAQRIKPLDRLAKLLASDHILKILHAADQDQECFQSLFGGPLAPVFDTQTAAMLLEPAYMPSYQALVENYLGITLDKALQRTNWAKRPLSEKALIYAAEDVLHLGSLYHTLKKNLQKKNRLAFMAQEIALSANLEDQSKPWTKVKDWSRVIKTRQAFTCLKKLACWREEKARETNALRKNILSDKALLALARTPHQVNHPESKTFSTQNPNLIKDLCTCHAQPPLACDPLPHRPLLTDIQKQTTAGLRTALENEAARLNIPMPFLLPQRKIEGIAQGKPLESLGLTPWRKALLTKACQNLGIIEGGSSLAKGPLAASPKTD